MLKYHFNQITKVDEFIHEKLLKAFRSYLIVGGMPEAVQSYVDDGDYNKILKIHLMFIDNNLLELPKSKGIDLSDL